jgi:F-type H+-transporting ATPase subunit delta
MPEDLSARDARLAVEIQPDVRAEQVAAVYAAALLGAAQRAAQTEPLLEEFDSFLADVLGRFPAFEQILASAQVSHEEKVGILDRALGGLASTVLLNFLKVVSRHGRLDCLRPIHRRVHELYDQARGRIRVRLATAQPIPDALAQRIADRLREMLHGEPMLERVADPDLIGGAVMRIGDTVYDGAVATQLQQMRQKMVDRSAHEIQSRRDRFRHSE